MRTKSGPSFAAMLAALAHIEGKLAERIEVAD